MLLYKYSSSVYQITRYRHQLRLIQRPGRQAISNSYTTNPRTISPCHLDPASKIQLTPLFISTLSPLSLTMPQLLRRCLRVLPLSSLLPLFAISPTQQTTPPSTKRPLHVKCFIRTRAAPLPSLSSPPSLPLPRINH